MIGFLVIVVFLYETHQCLTSARHPKNTKFCSTSFGSLADFTRLGLN